MIQISQEFWCLELKGLIIAGAHWFLFIHNWHLTSDTSNDRELIYFISFIRKIRKIMKPLSQTGLLSASSGLKSLLASTISRKSRPRRKKSRSFANLSSRVQTKMISAIISSILSWQSTTNSISAANYHLTYSNGSKRTKTKWLRTWRLAKRRR